MRQKVFPAPTGDHARGFGARALATLAAWHAPCCYRSCVAEQRKEKTAMNSWTSFVAASLLAVALVTPAWALTVKIETEVPLADHSDETLNLAIRRAVQSGVDGATAMG